MVGGESGSDEHYRLMTLDDAEYLVLASQAAGCKVHFKQLGLRLAKEQGINSKRGGGEHRAKGGHPDQFPKDLKLREWPANGATVAPQRITIDPVFDPKRWIHFKNESR